MSRATAQLQQALHRLLVLQLVLIAVVAMAGYAWQGTAALRAASFGGVIAIFGTLVLLRYGRRAEQAGANVALNAGLIYGSAIVRFISTMALFSVGIAVLRLQPLWLFAGFIAGLVAQMALTALVPETKKWRAKR